MSKVYKIFSEEVEKYYRRKSGAVRAHGGSICVIQRFSGDLSVNVHYCLLAGDGKSKVTEVSEETADILIIFCSIANRLDVDLEKAFREKEEINSKRVWKRQ